MAMMRAALFETPGKPLKLTEVPRPQPADDQVLLKVVTCGVCRTDVHIYSGDLKTPKVPLILGHQIVGMVEKRGKNANRYPIGTRVGISWLGNTCGKCFYCKQDLENLCEHAQFTGFDMPGGFAEYTTVTESFAYALPDQYSDIEVAPLLCGGIIGYRGYEKVRSAKTIGFFGFGSAAHILCQLAAKEGKNVIAFTRPGDQKTQQFALSLGAKAAYASDEVPNEVLDAAIIFAADGTLFPRALASVRKGGMVVCAEITMSDIPSFPYSCIAGEKHVQTLSNLRRKDAESFLQAAGKIKLHARTQTFPLDHAQEAIDSILHGKITGSAVIVI